MRGRVVRSPRPATFHGLLVGRVVRALGDFVDARGLGVAVAEGGVLLARDPDTVRGPDVAFYSRQRIPANAYGTTFWGPPDLAVEIVSPSNKASEIAEKVVDYLSAGVRQVWVIDPPARTASVHRADGTTRHMSSNEALEGEDVLAGFRLPLAGFFEL